MSKYHCRKTELMGHVFDSAAEARRYQELLFMEKAGEISTIELQPEFVLIQPFTYMGKKYRGVKYRADFRYTEIVKPPYLPRDPIVEDVKGHRTREYSIKKQLLLTLFPDINFVEIEA